MKLMPKFVDMAMSPQERKEEYPSFGDAQVAQPVYPWGLSLRLGQDELDKLGMTTDASVGDMVLLSCMAKVTSVSSNETTDGTRCNIELQITAMAAEGDTDETEAAPARPTRRPGNLYQKK